MNDTPTLSQLEALGPDRAAAFWLERLQGGESSQDARLFDDWLGASEANRRAWTRASALWDSLDLAADDDLAELRKEALTYRPSFTERWGRPLAIAATVAVVIGAGVIVGRNWQGGLAGQNPAGDPSASAATAFQHYSTAVGERSTLTLADGSRLTLDTDSAADVAVAQGPRRVRLVRGQAYFEVAPDPTRPFRVAAAGRIVAVTGTKFNVRVTNGEVRVALAQGAVVVGRGGDPSQPMAGPTVRLSPGEQLVALPGLKDAVSPVDMSQQLEWRQGFIQFDEEPLGAAVAEMSRYTTTKLVVRDSQVAKLRISGRFPATDIDGFAKTVALLYPVRVIDNGRGEREIVRR